MISRHFTRKMRTPGFSLIELLVVIAILALLMGLVFVALRTSRRSGDRAESLNALRQMTNAYMAYATEHNGRLLPGYLDPGSIGAAPNQIDISCRLRTGFVLNAQDTASYVWRLAPYLDHKWDVYMIDYRDEQLVGALETEFGQGDGGAGQAYGPGTTTGMQLGIARIPSYGLNSLYLGGDNYHGPVDRSPWANLPAANPATIAAQRLSDVKNPAKIIVFGACRDSTDVTDKPRGYCELRAPFADFNPTTQAGSDPQWTVDVTVPGQITFNGSAPAGVPVSRLKDDRVPISHLDGSVEAEYLARLGVDMSRWSPKALSQQ
jgi:prepilin-type N-terminal cleavage/methylation domain-containing protein